MNAEALKRDIVRRFGVTHAVAEKMIKEHDAKSKLKASVLASVRQPVRAADETNFDEDPAAWRNEVQRRMQAIEIMEEGTKELKDTMKLLKRVTEAEQKLIATKIGSVNKKDDDWWDMQHSGWAMGGREMFAQKLFNLLQGLDEAKLAAYIMDKIGFKRSIPIDDDDVAPLIPMDLEPGQMMPGEKEPEEEELVPEDAEGVEAMLVRGAKQVRGGPPVKDLFVQLPTQQELAQMQEMLARFHTKLTGVRGTPDFRDSGWKGNIQKARVKTTMRDGEFMVDIAPDPKKGKGYKIDVMYYWIGTGPSGQDIDIDESKSFTVPAFDVKQVMSKVEKIATPWLKKVGTALEAGASVKAASANKNAVKKYMQKKVGDFLDRRTGEVNTTKLAEDAADEFKNDGWLDDETHWVWDLAIDVGEWFEMRASVAARPVKADAKADIEKWIKNATKHIEKITTEKDPEKSFMKRTLGFTKGKKYYRVYIERADESGADRSAYCFIDMEGNIYKADSWKRPAKGIRGTVHNVDPNKIDQYTSWLYRR